MQHTKTIEIPATTKTVTDFVTCDLCKEKIKEEGNYDIREIEVSYAHGSNYGNDGGDKTEVSFDLCDKCFTGKLVPWIMSQGAEPNITKTSW